VRSPVRQIRNSGASRLRTTVFAGCLASCFGCSPGMVLSPFGSKVGVNGRNRPSPHLGVDLRVDPVRHEVLAAADGIVESVNFTAAGGGEVVVRHPWGQWTRYGHIAEVTAQEGNAVVRGQLLGRVGMFPLSGGVLHLHFELCFNRMCRPGSHVDPMPRTHGCFNSEDLRVLPAGYLTLPVRC